ncbi:MAG: pseudouridine synthase [Immundisolibacteraceae bacterium]|nr:pseudouridine synthase [Immundisolibacteraceae bacterium]
MTIKRPGKASAGQNKKRSAARPASKVSRRPRQVDRRGRVSAGPAPGFEERVQKVIANSGLGSRREVEQWIREGEVSINGKLAELGQRVNNTDRIRVRGRPIATRTPAKQRVLIYHKPVGELCSRSDPQGRPVVFERLPSLAGQRWISIGRLDMNTSGLLLFTTDGELANGLMHPSSEISREYLVRVLGEVSRDHLRRVSTGVTLEDGEAHFEEIDVVGGKGANRWYRVLVREGRNRLVRRLWESQGLTVSRLKRSSYGPIALPRDLGRGRWVEADSDQLKSLANALKAPTD